MNVSRPIEELAAGVKAGELSAVSLVQESLEVIKKHDSYHAVLEVNEAALDSARAIDEAIKASKDVGRLAGVPYIAKDNFLTKNTHTTAASNILKPFEAPYQATAIEKLEAEGAIMVAKANLDAFAHGSSTENSDFGPTKNPWDESRVPGGSSGGSAAAVALELASFALGTDTGGSIRLPASFTGTVGLKPTYGLVSRSGVIAMGSSFDVIGPITRTVDDAALVLDVIAGQDQLDATTIDREDSYLTNAGNLSGKRIGLLHTESLDEDLKASFEQLCAKLEGAGATIEPVNVAEDDLALACYYVLVPAEISSNLERYDGVKYGHSAPEAKNLAETYDLSRDQGFGSEAKRRILIGTYVLSSGYYDAYYRKAQTVRTLLINKYKELFEKYDLLLGPTAANTAFKLGERDNDPLKMYTTDVATVTANLIGSPAISLPLALDSQGLPIGVQLMAPQRSEKHLLSCAKAIEELVKFEAKPKVVS